MGITAENIAKKYGITRQEQDEFAASSQQKAEKAIKAGKFKDEIVPVQIPQGKGEPLIFDTDEFPKFGTTVEGLAKMRPAFPERRNGHGRQRVRDQRWSGGGSGSIEEDIPGTEAEMGVQNTGRGVSRT